MTELEERVRADLQELAGEIVTPWLPSGPDYRRTVRRRTRFVAPIAVAAAAAVVVAGTVVLVQHGPTGVPPAQGGPGSWPTRGSLANDSALIKAAVNTWDAAPVPASELPPQDVHALYAEHSVAGDTVVLTGIDAQGQRRIVWLNTDPTDHTAFRHRLHLVADVLAPKGNDTGLIGLQEWRPTPRSTNDHVVIAVGAPTARDLQWADEVHQWRRIPARDGAGLDVVAAKAGLLGVTVRAGNDGHGTQVLGDIPLQMVQPSLVDYEAGPSTAPPSASNEHCTGNVCEGSASVGPMTIGVGKPPTDGWTDLGASAVPMNDSERLQGWTTFEPEAQLMAQSLHNPGSGYSEGASWSALLPDDTGCYLVNYTAAGHPERLILYVDRPEWYGGRAAVDLTVSGPVPAIGALVPDASNRVNLIVVTGDGYRVQWTRGSSWHDLAVGHNAAEVDVTGIPRSQIGYRILDQNGNVVATGKPSTSALH